MTMCIYKYTNSSVDPGKGSYEFNHDTDYCILLTCLALNNYPKQQ